MHMNERAMRSGELCSTSPRCAVQTFMQPRLGCQRKQLRTCCVLALDTETGPANSSRRTGGLPAGLTVEQLPKHVAVIMDGNRRWARQQGLKAISGHQAGVTALRQTVTAAVDWGIPALTVFAFSTENWQRSRGEVDFLMALFQSALSQYLPELHQQQVVVRFIGDLQRLPPSLRAVIARAEALTRHNPGLQLTIAMGYSGRQDLVGAVQQIAAAVAAGQLQPHQVTEELLAGHLSTAPLTQHIGPPDLLIRTSGEQRLSNYLLWDLAYTELAFEEVCWPDFGQEQFARALRTYCSRQRRFGVA